MTDAGRLARPVRALLVLCALGVSALAVGSGAQEPSPAGDSKYAGSKKCEICHNDKDKGDPYLRWEGGPHAKAFEVLGTSGITDPETSEQCLPCHTTAHGVPQAQLQRGFDPKGVGCEACHGPGDSHFKERFKSAAKSGSGPVEISPDEIVARPPLATCLGCHNERSPTFKPFCYKERWEKVAHLDPRKSRSEEELKAMKCSCEPCTCRAGECGTPYPDKE